MSHRHVRRYFLQPAATTFTGTLSLPIDQVITATLLADDPLLQYNYAEALQKSIYFYEAQKSGPGVTGGRVSWRGDADLVDMVVPLQPFSPEGTGTNMSQPFIDAHRQWLDPEGKGTIDVSGGFHDAGDHVKFGLPQGYTASTLGWALYEFRQAFSDTGLITPMLEILRWFTDYFLRCTFRDDQGNVIAFAYQVGDGNKDHAVWIPAEVKKVPRPVYFATAETPASDVSAQAAASLALMYLNMRDTDSAYATTCLHTAQALYHFAAANRGISFSGGFYNSTGDEDEMSWAAIWLYVATNQHCYLDEIIATDAQGCYTGHLKKLLPKRTDTWRNEEVHNWDVVWGGVFLKLAHMTDNPQFWDIARWNLECWSSIPHIDPNDHTYIPATPSGFKVMTMWGSARYNATAQLCALMYRKYTGRTDFADWARGQMNYIMGQNPLRRSYIVGFGTNAVCHPHHRGAHGSFTGDLFDPAEHYHILWGALAGGPDVNDHHTDVIDDYVGNEVALDYNAGFVGALAGLYTYYGQGQQPLQDFSPVEDAVEQYFVEAAVDQQKISIILHNDSIHPPHFERNMKVRYFFNSRTSSTIAPADVTVKVSLDEQEKYDGPITIRGPLAWDDAKGCYYYEFDWSGYDIWGKRRIEFALTIAGEADTQQLWNTHNDWSHQGLSETSVVTPYIPVYLDERLVYGEEPPISS